MTTIGDLLKPFVAAQAAAAPQTLARLVVRLRDGSEDAASEMRAHLARKEYVTGLTGAQTSMAYSVPLWALEHQVVMLELLFYKGEVVFWSVGRG